MSNDTTLPHNSSNPQVNTSQEICPYCGSDDLEFFGGGDLADEYDAPFPVSVPYSINGYICYMCTAQWYAGETASASWDEDGAE